MVSLICPTLIQYHRVRSSVFPFHICNFSLIVKTSFVSVLFFSEGDEVNICSDKDFQPEVSII